MNKVNYHFINLKSIIRMRAVCFGCDGGERICFTPAMNKVNYLQISLIISMIIKTY